MNACSIHATANGCRAVPLAHVRLHGRDHRTLGTEPLDVLFQLAPGFAVFRPSGPAGPVRQALRNALIERTAAFKDRRTRWVPSTCSRL
jgi:hypothetical protein